MTKAPIHWSEVYAIYGGTFDPPHLGHREAALGLFKNPRVKKVLLLPSRIPPLKSSFTPFEHRLAMLKLLFREEITKGLVEILDPAEISTTETSFTFPILSSLGQKYDSSKCAFVLGTDQIADLPRWHRYPEVLALSHWLVLARQPDGPSRASFEIENLAQTGVLKRTADRVWQVTVAGSPKFMTWVETPARALSASEIRKNITIQGVVPPETLTQDVETYLRSHGLYGTHKTA